MPINLEQEISDIKTKLAEVATKVDNIEVLFTKNDNLESRIRDLENFKWKVIGIVTALNSVIGLVIFIANKVIN